MTADPEQRVLVCAPTGRDAALACATLIRAGLDAQELASCAAVVDALSDGAGCVVLTQEALNGSGLEALLGFISTQAPWSDLPVVVLTTTLESDPGSLLPEELLTSANVTLFERPVRMETLVAGVRAALRARSRQYGARATLEQVQRQAGALLRAAAERQELLESERAARRAAEEANRAKDEFLAVVSHELRTPLSAILGWIGLLQGGRATPERLAHGLEVIERSAQAQARLVEDLLDISKIITGKLRLEVVDTPVEAFIAPALEAVRLSAEARRVSLRPSLAADGAVVRGDATRLQQVIWNLLHNAIKFSPAGSIVELRAAVQGGALHIAVADQGRGISTEFLPFIFDRFRQAESPTTRSTGGLGLGLAISRHVVELHGGTIEVESAGLDRGTTFLVRLPLGGPAREQGLMGGDPDISLREASDQQPSLRGVRVLLVDDDRDTREFLRTLIEQVDGEVLEAASASEALSLVNQREPSVVVSDIGMPGEDGLNLMRRLRALPAPSARTPGIALTAFARAEDQRAALEAGFQLHLAKPVTPGTLLRAIASLAHGAAQG